MPLVSINMDNFLITGINAKSMPDAKTGDIFPYNLRKDGEIAVQVQVRIVSKGRLAAGISA